MAGSSISVSRQGHNPGSSLHWSGALLDPPTLSVLWPYVGHDSRWVTAAGTSSGALLISGMCGARDLHPAQAGRSECLREEQRKLTFILHRQAAQQAPHDACTFRAATYTNSGITAVGPPDQPTRSTR